VDEICSGSCPMTGFGINDVETLGPDVYVNI
jgi:hypothetical protein